MSRPTTFGSCDLGHRAGIVYLAESLRTSGIFKLGHTTDLRKRLAQINRVEPIQLVSYITTNDRTRLECALKRQWHSCRVVGEWFRLSDSHVSAFRAVSVVNWKSLPFVQAVSSDCLSPKTPSDLRYHRPDGYVIRPGQPIIKTPLPYHRRIATA